MSLIDNMKAPLVNLGPLVTILLIALLFGVLRLSGGGLSFSSASSTDVPKAVAVPVRSIPAAREERAPVRGNSDRFLDEIVRQEGVDPRQPVGARPGRGDNGNAARDAQADPNKKGGLAELESELGLR